MFKEGGVWCCHECPYRSPLKHNMFEHIESKHVQHNGYLCDFCEKICPTQGALRKHKAYYKH